MKSPLLPFLAFLILFCLVLPVSSDYATSVVPGWHTTVLPPYFIAAIIIVCLLAFATIGYWMLLRRGSKANLIMYLVHFSATIPAIIFIRFPSIFLDIQGTDQDALLRELAFRTKLIPFVFGVFMAGQLLFIFYFLSTVYGKKPNTMMEENREETK